MAGLGEVSRLALALPEALEADHHGIASFRIRGKIFATVRAEPPVLMVKLDGEDQHNFCQAHPEVVSPVPGYWGRKGSTFVAYERAGSELLATLLKIAWTRVAPRRLHPAG